MDYFIYRSSVYRHPHAFPPAPLSSLVPLCVTIFRTSCEPTGACKQGSLQSLGKIAVLSAKSLAKTAFWVQRQVSGKKAFLGAERTKSLEEQLFWVQSNQIPGKTALLGAERTKSLEKQHLWVQSEPNPWGSSFVLLRSGLYRWNFGGSYVFM